MSTRVDVGGEPAGDLPSGYASPRYAAALLHIGRPRVLPASGASLLVCPIPGTAWVDARAPYPLLVAPNWPGVREDLDRVAAEGGAERPVSVVAVVTPFCSLERSGLEEAFPDLCARYKEHFVVDLSIRSGGGRSRHHERNVRKALASIAIERLSEPLVHLDEWCALYDVLRARHAISGPADFPRASFERQLAVPGLTAFRAVVRGQTIGMTLWFETGDVGYYHLGAYSSLGYELGASFALFASAIDHFRQVLAWLDLGAGAGTVAHEDGLTRFKRGFATDTRPAFLCGRILDPVRHAALLARMPGVEARRFFPAYRTPVA